MEQNDIIIINQAITRSDLKKIAEKRFGDMVKGVADIKTKTIALGGELHADEESLLLEQGSKQANLWGINLYPDKYPTNWIEFDSMINIRPRQNNRSRTVEDKKIQEKIIGIVNNLIK